MNEPDRPVDVPGHLLERVIGRGATSVVWAGRDAAGWPVAIKVPHERPDEVDLAQSAAEREVLTAVRHEHLVSLRAVVPLTDHRVATVFDLVDGASLRSTVDARGHLRPGETVTVVLPVCDAVAALHRAGAIHGDVSPGNILITAGGRPLLADLGGARVAGTGAVVVGTPGFVAPEVLRGEAPSMAADVFSLGAVAWFCLTGSAPPQSPIRMSLEEVTSQLGPELALVVADSIDPEQSRRPSAQRLTEALYASAPPEPIEVVLGADEASALTHRLRLNAAAVPDGATAGTGDRHRMGANVARVWHRARALLRGHRMAVALGALALVAGGAFLVVRPLDGASDAVATEPAAAPLPTEAGGRRSGVREGTSRPAPPSGGTRPSKAAGVSDLLADPRAPQRDPEALMRALAERRAAVLVARDPQGLADVHHRGSASWAADAQLLVTLERNHLRYRHLGVAQVEARTISFVEGRAVVRTRVGLTAYEVLDAAGLAEPRPASRGQDLDVTVVRTASGWRIDSVSEPTAT